MDTPEHLMASGKTQSLSREVLLVGSNHHQTPLEVREQMAMTPSRLELLETHLRAAPCVHEHLVLSTCNRLEVYVVIDRDVTDVDPARMVCDVLGFPLDHFETFAYRHTDGAAIEHLYAVCSGLDSLMVGETEILGQVKQAYARAGEKEQLGPVLHRVFQKAFAAAKWARTETGIGHGQVSLGNICVELAQRIFGTLRVSRTLVVGSGEVGRDVAKAFRSRGVSCMTITSRTHERAVTAAKEIDGLIIPYEKWTEQLPYFDIVIFATSAPIQILTAETLNNTLRKRHKRPIFLIDLAVPRDVDPAAGEVSNVYLYTFEDLAEMANSNLKAREAEILRCREGLQLRAGFLWKSLGYHLSDEKDRVTEIEEPDEPPQKRHLG